MVDHCTNELRRRTAAFVVEVDRELQTIGTGVLLSVGSRRFIVTATHVVDEFTAARRPVLLSGGINPGRLLQLPPSQVWAIDGTWDVCVIELRDDVLTPSRDLQYCGLENVGLFDDGDPRDVYAIHGYPTNDSRMDYFEGQYYCDGRTYCSGLNPIDVPIPGVDRSTHMSLRWLRGMSGEEEPAAFDTPHGMSGSGIWRVLRHDAREQGMPMSELRLVGIAIAANPEYRAFIATRIAWILQMIGDKYSDSDRVIKAAFAVPWK